MFLGQDQNLQIWKAVKAHELEASDWFNDNVSKFAKKKGCAFTSAGVVSAFHVKVMSGSQISECQELNGCVFTKRQWKRIPLTEWEPCDSDAEKKTLRTQHMFQVKPLSPPPPLHQRQQVLRCYPAELHVSLVVCNHSIQATRTWVSSVSNCGAGSAVSGSGACGSAAAGSFALWQIAGG